MPIDKQPVDLPGLSPREAVLDAYYRLAWALDLNDWELFESCWATESEPEFLMEKDGIYYRGLGEIKKKLFDVVCGLDTQHIATNARVHLQAGAKTAKVWIMALNQHYRKGQAAKAGAPRLWGGNIYVLDAVEENGKWKIQKWWVELGWNEGDLSIVGR